MEDFNLITVDTLNKYFDILSKAGYVKSKEVNKVIILTFLSRLLNDFSEYITERTIMILLNLFIVLVIA